MNTYKNDKNVEDTVVFFLAKRVLFLWISASLLINKKCASYFCSEKQQMKQFKKQKKNVDI